MNRRHALAAIAAALAAPAVARAATRLKVATSFTVLADMARNVAGDLADIESITKPGGEIHGYEPTPRDLVRAQGAGLVLYNGLNLERWFAQFLRNLSDVAAAVVSTGIDPIAVAAGADAQAKPNPHGWMALDSALIYTRNIAEALAGADPANAEAYRANARAYADRITATIAPLRDALRALPADRRWLATSEGAFSYLARDAHLRELYLWPINADAQGTPQQVRHVVDVMRAEKVPAIFSESTVSDRPARRIAAETGARYGGTLYVDSLSAADGPVPSYLDLLRVTHSTILKGLSDG